MIETGFQRSVRPFEPSQIVYLRTQLRYPKVGTSRALGGSQISPAHSLLLFSLTYGAGAAPLELALMRVETLLDDNGDPAKDVRFLPEVTKHRVPRRVVMHPDIARDLRYFREVHPHEEWVAFRSSSSGLSSRRPLTESALQSWFRAQLQAAGLTGFSLRSGRKTFLDAKRRQAR